MLTVQRTKAMETLQAHKEAATGRVPALQINVIPWPADRFCVLRL